MRARYERLQEENAEKEAALKAVNDRQRVEIEGFWQHNEMEPDEDSEEEDSEEENELD